MVKPLTKREEQALELLIEGYTNKEISHRLDITLNTVKTHLRMVFDKLDVSRRTQAVRRSRELGLFQ